MFSGASAGKTALDSIQGLTGFCVCVRDVSFRGPKVYSEMFVELQVLDMGFHKHQPVFATTRSAL